MSFKTGVPSPQKGQGKGIAWLRAHVSYQGSNCLTWPFSRVRGYGNVSLNGKIYYAHRMMCELVHGPAPAPEYEVAHSCGKGHEGCINPLHLSWKTRGENQADKRAHGTSGKGRRRYKLTPEQVVEIRSLQGAVSVTNLAAKFRISRGTIRQIHLGQIWRTGQYEYGGFVNPQHPVHLAKAETNVSNVRGEDG